MDESVAFWDSLLPSTVLVHGERDILIDKYFTMGYNKQMSIEAAHSLETIVAPGTVLHMHGRDRVLNSVLLDAAGVAAPYVNAALIYNASTSNSDNLSTKRRNAFIAALVALGGTFLTACGSANPESVEASNQELTDTLAKDLGIHLGMTQQELADSARLHIEGTQFNEMNRTVGTFVDGFSTKRQIVLAANGELDYDITREAKYITPYPVKRYEVKSGNKSITFIGSTLGEARMKKYDAELQKFINAYFPDADYPQNLYMIFGSSQNYGALGTLPAVAYATHNGTTGFEVNDANNSIASVNVAINVEMVHGRALTLGLTPSASLAGTLANERYDIVAARSANKYLKRQEEGSSMAGLLSSISSNHRELLLGGPDATNMLPIFEQEMNQCLRNN